MHKKTVNEVHLGRLCKMRTSFMRLISYVEIIKEGYLMFNGEEEILDNIKETSKVHMEKLFRIFAEEKKKAIITREKREKKEFINK